MILRFGCDWHDTSRVCVLGLGASTVEAAYGRRKERFSPQLRKGLSIIVTFEMGFCRIVAMTLAIALAIVWCISGIYAPSAQSSRLSKSIACCRETNPQTGIYSRFTVLNFESIFCLNWNMQQGVSQKISASHDRPYWPHYIEQECWTDYEVRRQKSSTTLARRCSLGAHPATRAYLKIGDLQCSL